MASAKGGPVWGGASADLNATKLVWPAGAEVAEHVADRDVVYIVTEGALSLTVGAEVHDLASGEGLIVEKGTPRAISVGPEGAAYFTAHRRRGGLQVRPAPPA